MLKSGYTAFKQEFITRKSYYIDDWKCAFLNSSTLFKTLSATLFTFTISVAPAITFSSYLETVTRKEYGVIEVLLSTGIAGALYAVCAGQPLIIVGITGPVTLFSHTLYTLTQSANVPYLPFMAWTGIGAGIFHILLGLSGGCRLTPTISRFSYDVFGSLVGVIYISTAMEWIVDTFRQKERGAGVLSLLLSLSFLWLAQNLGGARGWTAFSKGVRAFLADYSIFMTMLLLSALYHVPVFRQVDVPLLSIPRTFMPTNGRREWMVNVLDLPAPAIGFAFLSGLILTILFFFDHNVSSLLAQQKKYNLKKPPAYNYDFFILGILLMITSVFGLPFYNGLIPQANLHVEALAKIKQKSFIDANNPSRPIKRAHYISVLEQRVSNFGQSVLTLVLVFIPPLFQRLGSIPVAVLDGLFLHMGISSFLGNEFMERLYVVLFVTRLEERSRAAPYCWLRIQSYHVSHGKIVSFTLLQFFFLVLIYGITRTQGGISFPVFIAVMVPLRHFIVTKPWAKLFYFSQSELDGLDGDVDATIGQEEVLLVAEEEQVQLDMLPRVPL